MNNLIRRPGGKKKMAGKVLPLIPPHVLYCEPFCGGLGFFAQKPRSKIEIVNDTDHQLINLFRVVKYHPGELDRELDGWPNSRANFKDFKEQKGFTDIQRAARFLYLNALSFGGDSQYFAVRTWKGHGPWPSPHTVRRVIPQLAARLEGVTIESLDWRRCVESYDGPETFFFFDPPYTDCDIRPYAPWTAEQMDSLAASLPTLKARWLVTVNDAPANRKRFARWRIRGFTRQRGVDNRDAKPIPYAELIVTDR